MSTKIRPLAQEDVPFTNLLHERIFGQFLETEAYVSESNFYYGFVLEKDKEIIGYLLGQIIYESAELFYVAVHPNFYGKNFGKQLVEAFINKARELGCENILLEVNTQNHPAIKMYEKCDFANIGIRKNYYGVGEDAILMNFKL